MMYFFSVLACTRKHFSVPLHANVCLKTPALLASAKFELVYVQYAIFEYSENTLFQR